MYTIKQAAVRSGVSVQLLRAWERRYGVVSPARTDSGYRLYDDLAIDRVRAMRRLIEDGWAPSTAAARVRDLDEASMATLAGVESTTLPVPVVRPGRAAHELADAFVAAAADLDEPAVEHILDDMFARGSFEQVTTDLVGPAMAALGEGWREGRIDIAAEHAAAGAVARRLGVAFMAAGRPTPDQRVVLVGLPPGARHELGALAFATAARRAGIEVRYLGADLPVQDWLDAVARTSAVGVVIGIALASDVDPAERVAHAIRAAYPRIVIAFGGPSASNIDLSSARPAMVLPDELTSAVDALRSAIGSGASRSDSNRTRQPRVVSSR